jgi:hypothetical protein
MEFLIPVLALGGLYTVTKQKSVENYENKNNTRIANELLPNMDVPNRNYPEEYPITNSENDLTSKLSTVNLFDSPSVYTDKYFNPALNEKIVVSVNDQNKIPGSVYRSMTGQEVDIDYFRHNNMAPFFGSKVHTNNLPNATESTLDNYTGSASQYIRKIEQSPLFAPSDHQQWAYGMPSTTDFVQSRMNPSMNMANVKPFEEERVAPGLNGENGNGFNSGMMARETWLPKTVDDLRISSNPKASHMLMGHEGPAVSRITNLGLLGQHLWSF